MPNQGQPIGEAQHSAKPSDPSSNLTRYNPRRGASWFRPALCALVAVAASGLWISCGDSPPGGGPGQTTQCQDNLPSDSLQAYTQKCAAAVGVDVPAFDCDQGTLVPETNLNGVYPNAVCDTPNVLNGSCDPGSRFQVLKETNEVAIVAHCRKHAAGDGIYRDIAVIQYNRINGATCFYQALSNNAPADGDLPAKVTPPSEGNDPAQGKFPWLSPSDTAVIRCNRCHDNGPFIRSPYLAQLRNEATNRLPGTNEDPNGTWDQRFTWNKTLPYKFIGNDFQSWKVYSVTLTGTGSGCIQCHRMGVSSIKGTFESSFGTALDFGLIATAPTQLNKNPHSEASPIWMKPYQTFFDQDVQTQAFAVSGCATALVQHGNGSSGLPIPAGCSAIEYGQGDTCTSVESGNR
jgi:hypothetical protein